jgi:hypothetical protein
VLREASAGRRRGLEKPLPELRGLPSKFTSTPVWLQLSVYE